MPILAKPLPATKSRAGTYARWSVIINALRFVLDLIAVTLGLILAYQLRAKLPFGDDFVASHPENNLLVLMVSTGSILFAFQRRGLYRLKRGYSKIDEFYRIVWAALFGIIIAIALSSVILGPAFQYSRLILVYALISVNIITFVVRLIFGAIVSFLLSKVAAQVQLVIVGTGQATQRILRKVSASPRLGYNIVGIISEHTTSEEQLEEATEIEGVPLIGHVNQLKELLRYYCPDELIIASSAADQQQLLEYVAMCDDLPIKVNIYPDAFQLITANEVTISELTGLPLVTVKDVALRGFNRAIKRIMDITISLIILVVMSPLMLLTAVLVKLTDPKGGVFYKQVRVGLDGKPITILKFRSMRVTSEANGPGWTKANDPRRTRFGSFIRRFSLDELPQFINVLLGDMSIVGPRPEQPQYVAQFSQRIPQYMRRHKEKAGLTGWAQINGLRGDTSIEERTRYDLYYVENWSIWFDLKIILKTIIVIFTDKNAY